MKQGFKKIGYISDYSEQNFQYWWIKDINEDYEYFTIFHDYVDANLTCSYSRNKEMMKRVMFQN